MIQFQCDSCGRLIRVADTAAGHKGKCPTCGIILTIPSTRRVPQAVSSIPKVATASPAAPPAEASSAEGKIAFPCSTCGREIKVAAAMAGRKGKCPTCQTVLTVPHSTSHGKKPIHVDTDTFSLGGLAEMETAAASVVRTEASHESSAASTMGGLRCPSCLGLLPTDSRICGHCGIYLPSGRPILTARDVDLDSLYIWVERVIRPVSFVICAGLCPVYSEAYGRKKPIAIWAIAILTIVISCWFWAQRYTHSSSMQEHKNLMLWSGDKQPTAAQILSRYFSVPNWGDIDAWSEKTEELQQTLPEDEAVVQAHQSLPPKKRVLGEYRGYQLITHAFLHVGIIHLAGNLLFLMIFGSRVNAMIGNIAAVVLYPTLAVMAGLLHLQMNANGVPSPMLGASGAIMGLAGVYMVLFPFQKVHLVVWRRRGLTTGFNLSWNIFATRGIFFVIAYMAFDFIFVAFQADDGIARWAHIGGFLAGCVLGVVLLACRLAYSGADLLSVIFGRHAWGLLGTPASRYQTSGTK